MKHIAARDLKLILLLMISFGPSSLMAGSQGIGDGPLGAEWVPHRDGVIRNLVRKAQNKAVDCPPRPNGEPRDCQLKMQVSWSESVETGGEGGARNEDGGLSPYVEDQDTPHTLMVDYLGIRVIPADGQNFNVEQCTVCTYGDSRAECVGPNDLVEKPLKTFFCSGSVHGNSRLGSMKPCPSTDTGELHEGVGYTLENFWKENGIYDNDFSTAIAYCYKDDALGPGSEDRCTFLNETLSADGSVLYFGVSYGQLERPEQISVICDGPNDTLLSGYLSFPVPAIYEFAEPEGRVDGELGQQECALKPFFLDQDGDLSAGGVLNEEGELVSSTNDAESPSFLGNYCQAPHMVRVGEWAVDNTDADCDDSDPNVGPRAKEICGDGIDNNCDGEIDPAWLCLDDWNGDGDGFSLTDGDCDDTDDAVYPGSLNEENAGKCNGVDDDCDGLIDEHGVGTLYWQDYDGDGFPNLEVAPISRCRLDPGYLPVPEDGTQPQHDCDDRYADSHPGAPERCDGVDNDCDTFVDDESVSNSEEWVCGSDWDEDGELSVYQGGTDCNDEDSDVNQRAVEECDGVDNDCDGRVDSDAVDEGFFYLDTDGDGYGDGSDSVIGCWPAPGYAEEVGDCEPDDARIHPDSIWYVDEDGDGFADTLSSSQWEGCDPYSTVWGENYIWTLDLGDCAEGDDLSFPGAVEWLDGVDNNCDGVVDDNAANPGFCTLISNDSPLALDLDRWVEGLPLCPSSHEGAEEVVEQRFHTRIMDGLVPGQRLVLDLRVTDAAGQPLVHPQDVIGVAVYDAAGVPIRAAGCVGGDSPLCATPQGESGDTVSFAFPIPSGFQGERAGFALGDSLVIAVFSSAEAGDYLYDLRLRIEETADRFEGSGGNNTQEAAFDLLSAALTSVNDREVLVDTRRTPEPGFAARPRLVRGGSQEDLVDMYSVVPGEIPDGWIVPTLWQLTVDTASVDSSFDLRVRLLDYQTLAVIGEQEQQIHSDGEPVEVELAVELNLDVSFFIQVEVLGGDGDLWLPYHLRLSTFALSSAQVCELVNDDDSFEPNNTPTDLAAQHQIFGSEVCDMESATSYRQDGLIGCPLTIPGEGISDGRDLFEITGLIEGDLVECAVWMTHNDLAISLSILDGAGDGLAEGDRFERTQAYTGSMSFASTVTYLEAEAGGGRRYLEVAFPYGSRAAYGLQCQRVSWRMPPCD